MSTGGIVYAEGHLSEVVDRDARVRNAGEQRNAGGSDRLATDDGGHFLATMFDGPAEGINLTAQDRGLNRGNWKAMENVWARELGPDTPIHVKVYAEYPPGSGRPLR